MDQIQDMGFGAMVLDDDPPGPELDIWRDSPWPTQYPVPTLHPGFSHSVTIWIQGMTCTSCVQAVEEQLARVGGLHSALVLLSDGTAMVTFDPSMTGPEQLKAVVEDVGFHSLLTS